MELPQTRLASMLPPGIARTCRTHAFLVSQSTEVYAGNVTHSFSSAEPPLVCMNKCPSDVRDAVEMCTCAEAGMWDHRWA